MEKGDDRPWWRAGCSGTMKARTHMETHPMTFLFAALITIVPLIVLIGAAVLTARINTRTGGQAAQLTYRAYSA
jgi:hypothetical protein